MAFNKALHLHLLIALQCKILPNYSGHSAILQQSLFIQNTAALVNHSSGVSENVGWCYATFHNWKSNPYLFVSWQGRVQMNEGCGVYSNDLNIAALNH